MRFNGIPLLMLMTLAALMAACGGAPTTAPPTLAGLDGGNRLTVTIDYVAIGMNSSEPGSVMLTTTAPAGWSVREQSLVSSQVDIDFTYRSLPDFPGTYAEGFIGNTYQTRHDLNGVTVYEFADNTGQPYFQRPFDETHDLLVRVFSDNDPATVPNVTADIVQMIANAQVSVVTEPTRTSANAMTDGFTAVVSGDINGEIVSAVSVDLCVAGVLNLTFNNTFMHDDNEPAGSIDFIFTPNTTPGTYTYDPQSDSVSPVEVSGYIEAPDGGTDYMTRVSATVTVDSVPTVAGESYSGTYELTLDNRNTLNGGTDATGTITVSGTFRQVMDALCTG